jgi:hypothetical protein
LSKLFRPKWDRRTDYRTRTIKRAMKGTVGGYAPTANAHDEADDGDDKDTSGSSDPSKSHASKLVRLVKNRANTELFHSPDNVAYVTVDGRTVRLSSPEFREWLSREYYLSTERVPSASALNDAIGNLCGCAKHEGTERHVFNFAVEFGFRQSGAWHHGLGSHQHARDRPSHASRRSPPVSRNSPRICAFDHGRRQVARRHPLRGHCDDLLRALGAR